MFQALKTAASKSSVATDDDEACQVDGVDNIPFDESPEAKN